MMPRSTIIAEAACSVGDHPRLKQEDAAREDGGMQRAGHRRVEAEVGLRMEPLNPGLDEKAERNREPEHDDVSKRLQQDAQDGLELDCRRSQPRLRQDETKRQRFDHEGGDQHSGQDRRLLGREQPDGQEQGRNAEGPEGEE